MYSPGILGASACCDNGAQPFLEQAAWAVDSVNGNDDGAGTPADPIRTLAELSRRWNGRTFDPAIAAVDVALTGTFSGEVLSYIAQLYGTVRIHGTPTVQATGITTAFTALAAPATDAKLTDTTTPIVWAAHVGRRVRLTSGANAGAIAWVLKDLGANQARVSQFVSLAGAAVAPAVNDTFVIETLDVALGNVDCFSNGPGLVNLDDISIVPIANTSGLIFAAGGNPSAFNMRGCRIHTNTWTTSFSTSAFRLVGCSNASQMFTGKGAIPNLVGHAAFANITCQQGGDVRFVTSASCFQGARLSISLGGYADNGAIIAIFDATGAGSSCISVDTGSSFEAAAAIMGINNTNTGAGVQTRSGGKFTWFAGAQPTITAVGGDAINGGAAAVTWAAIAASPQSAILNANNGAMIGLRS